MLRKIAVAAALAAGALLFACPPAQASTTEHCDNFVQSSGPNVGLLNGLNLGVPIDLGLNVEDNALGPLGLANAGAGDDNDTVTCNYGYAGGYGTSAR